MAAPIELGDFPPCPGVTEEEVEAIRSLTKYRTEKEEKTDETANYPVVTDDVKILLVRRDQQNLNLLGRISQWCYAYHERIGFSLEPSVKTDDATSVAP